MFKNYNIRYLHILYFRTRFLLILEIQYFALFFSILASLATLIRKYNLVRDLFKLEIFAGELYCPVTISGLLFVSFSMSAYPYWYFLLVLINYFTIKIIWSRHCLDASTSFLSGQCVYIWVKIEYHKIIWVGMGYKGIFSII